MDFMTLLSVAQNNKSSNQPAAYYPTKFTPPKKESKQSKDLSQNIKKFLSRKEEEEKRKAEEDNKKKQHLLALRDEKAQKRINKHLKACKDSNKSVLEDAVDNKNTSLTIPGTSQIVTDDYGYVSQEATALYDKLMNKYNSMPAEKPLFTSSGKKTVKDIELTKARVKEALKQEKFEESRGHRRKSKTTVENSQAEEEESVSQVSDEEKGEEKERIPEKLKSKKKAMPPPMNFAQLLKLAEQKQHEPIVAKVIPKKKEPEILKTRKEYVKEKEWLDKKEDRRRGSENTSVKKTSAVVSDKLDKKIVPKAEIYNEIKKSSTEKDPKFKSSETVKKSVPRPGESSNSKSKNIEKTSKDKSKDDKNKHKDELLEERRKLEIERRKLEEMRRSIEEDKKKLNAAKEKNKVEQKPSNHHSTKIVNKIGNASLRESDKGNSKSGKDKILVKHKANTMSKKLAPSKRRAIFDDDEDEYDSELDGFIADEPEEEEQDISKYISEIFGYDKSKYRYIDEDDSAMESNFAQQLKEEFISTKTGIMEDLEDIRKEAHEKKRKAMMKKKRRI